MLSLLVHQEARESLEGVITDDHREEGPYRDPTRSPNLGWRKKLRIKQAMYLSGNDSAN